MLELRSRLYERPLNRLLTCTLSRGDSLRRSGDTAASRLLQTPGPLEAPGRSSAPNAGVGVSSSLGAAIELLAADITERIDE